MLGTFSKLLKDHAVEKMRTDYLGLGGEQDLRISKCASDLE